METVLNNYIGERGRAKFTIKKYVNSNKYSFTVESPYFTNSNYSVRCPIWSVKESPSYFWYFSGYRTTYTYTYTLPRYIGTLYNIHVYLENNSTNELIFLDEAVFQT